MHRPLLFLSDLRRDSAKLEQARLCARCSVGSKFDGAERVIRNWMMHQRKLLNAGTLKAEDTSWVGVENPMRE